MKKIIYIIIGSLGLLSACTKDFQELNVDPNNPVKASSQSILLEAQRGITHGLLDDNNIFVVLNWVQYTAVNGYNSQPFDYNWNTDATYNVVTGVLENLELLRKQAIKDNHVNYEAIAMIMKAWVNLNFTDIYGDIPYSEAQKGDEGILYPKYDSQEEIYTGLVTTLKEAAQKIDVLQTNGKVDESSDIFCQGNMLKWKKFANSLRARIYLRMSESDNEVAKAGLEEIFGDPATYPVVDDNSFNVGVSFIEKTSNANTNIFVSEARAGAIFSVSSTMVELLCANDDPRRKVFLNPTKKSVDSVGAGVWNNYVYRGVPPVFLNPMTSFNQTDVSTVGDDLSLDYSRPIDVLTYSEVMFIRAEAASKKYNVGGDIQQYYEAGIRGSMEKWGVTDDALIENYINGPFASFDPMKEIEQILTQRYIDQFSQALNTFAMIRRSGYPKLKWINVGFGIDNGYPDRMPYAFNMKTDPGYKGAVSDVNQSLWGNVWFAKQTVKVNTAPAYQNPISYQFPDK